MAVAGPTPYVTDRFPVGAYEFRLDLEGYESLHVARSLASAYMVAEILNTGFDYLEDPSYVIDVRMHPEASLPDGMVPVSGGPYATVPVDGFQAVQPVLIPDYFIDRTEVTNAAFAEFVTAGGYEAREFLVGLDDSRRSADRIRDSTGGPHRQHGSTRSSRVAFGSSTRRSRGVSGPGRELV